MMSIRRLTNHREKLMKKTLLSMAAIILTLACSGMAYANDGEGDHKGPPPPGAPPFMEEALSQLPEKDAEKFRDTMRQAHEKNRAIHEQMRQLHEELHRIMTAEKFDKSAFIAKNNELKQMQDMMFSNMTEAFAAALSGLSQGERKTLADAMRTAMPHGPHDGPPPPHGPEKPDSDAPAPARGSDQ